MKNNKRNIIIGIILGVLLIAGSIFAVTLILKNENAFNMNEKKYMINNKSSLKSISVVNDANVFGRDGTGIYYDFLDKLEKETDLSFNIVTSSVQIDQTGLALTKGNYLPENSKLLYTDHFVLVGKKHVAISGLDKISGTIGYLSKDSEPLQTYLNKYTLATTNYDNKTALLDALEANKVDYILVPRLEYLDRKSVV